MKLQKNIREREVFEINYNYCPQCSEALQFVSQGNKQVLQCKSCGFTFWNNPRPVVSAIIEQKGKILLIKRNGETYKNYWALPGGVIDYLEEPDVAVKREVCEETGLIVTDPVLFDAYLIVYAPNGLTKLPSHTSIDLVYTVKVKSDISIPLQIPDRGEVSEIEMFAPTEIPSKVAFGHRHIISKFFKNR